jgi:hypothetical protein
MFFEISYRGRQLPFRIDLDITNQKVICRLLKTVWKMSSEGRFGRLSDAEMEKMMSYKDAVNTNSDFVHFISLLLLQV